MKVIKRDGHVVDYSPEKIEAAIQKANAEVDEELHGYARTSTDAS